MEKWKIAAIALLLGGLAGYGFYQQPGGLSGNTPEPTPATEQEEPPPAWLASRIGKTPPAWNIPANYWLNTPKPITPADVKNKVTVLEFWRMGCSHCEEAIPHLNEIYQYMKPRGLQMIAIQTPGNVDDPKNPENSWPEVQRFVREHKIKYPVAFDKNGALFKKVYNGQRYPTVLVIDRKGVVHFAQTGFTPDKAQRLTRTLMKLLA